MNKRINLPESVMIVEYLKKYGAIDYKEAAELIDRCPTMTRRYLKALRDADIIHIKAWAKDRRQPGPYWPVYALGDDDDAIYPGEEVKRQRQVRRKKAYSIDPIMAALMGVHART